MRLHVSFYKKLFGVKSGRINREFRDANSCAIVGNSGNLNNSSYGADINGHEYIIRFNAAPVEGYEEDVGSRTTHRFINVLLQRGKTLNHTTNTPENYIETIRNEAVILKNTSKRIQKKAERSIDSSCQVFKISRRYRRFYGKVFQDYLDKDYSVSTLSLGLQGIFIFLPIIDNISVFGFDCYQSNDISKYHYWENFTEDDQGPHDYDKESKILNELEKNGCIEIYR